MKNYLKFGLSFLLFVTTLTSCEDDVSFIENTAQSKYKTLNIDDAKDFLTSQPNDFLITKSNNINLKYDIELLTYESINNSNESLIVVPATIRHNNVYSRILLLKVNGVTKSVLFNMIPVENSTSKLFTGKISITDLEGNFKSAFKVENGVMIKQYFIKKSKKNTFNAKSECEEDYAAGQFCYNDLDEVEITGSNGGGGGYWNLDFDEDEYNDEDGGHGDYDESWDYGDGGGGSPDPEDTETTCNQGYVYNPSTGVCVEEEYGTDCKSFDFEKTTATWQEAAITNIHKHIYLLSPSGVKYKYTISFPQAILFGMPANLANGGEVSTGIAAMQSAEILDLTFKQIGTTYALTHVSGTDVDIAFKDKLKDNYQTYIPGGRVQFNATNYTVTSREYSTKLWGNGNCDD